MRSLKNSSRTDRSSAGLTLVEVVVVVGLLGIVLSSMNAVLGAIAGTYRSGTARMEVDAQGTRTIQRLARALRLADAEQVVGLVEAPFFTTDMEFRQSTGFQEGQTGWDELERLRYSALDGTLTWTRENEDGDEGVLFRCENVATLQAGETANGLDDNGNGLVDEPGFCVALEGDLITAWLTLEEPDHAGRPIEKSWSMRIQCRN